MDATYYDQAKLVIKHTFIEFQCLDEQDSPKLRRHKSDPCFASATPTECAMDASKYMEPLTPTTCASVNGDDDNESSLSSPCTIDEDDASSQGNKFSFSDTVVNGLLNLPQAPLQ